jgi:hypothetical protein
VFAGGGRVVGLVVIVPVVPVVVPVVVVVRVCARASLAPFCIIALYIGVAATSAAAKSELFRNMSFSAIDP